MLKPKYLFLIFVLSFLCSCGKSEQEIRAERWSELESINDGAVNDLVLKHNAVVGWDTIKMFTSYYQRLFLETNNLISFEGEIEDIIKLNDSYILKIHYNTLHYRSGSYGSHFLAEVIVDSQKFREIEPLINSNIKSFQGCFIFKVSKIVSVSPEIKSEIELEGEDSYSYLYFDFNNNLLIFKGDFIDFYLNEIIEGYKE